VFLQALPSFDPLFHFLPIIFHWQRVWQNVEVFCEVP
jgi:hypothetical protein